MDAEELVTYPTEAFHSRDYLEDEKRLLWPKIWQMVEREEDLPNPGDWLTYNVADESVDRAAQGRWLAPRLPQCLPASRPPAGQRARHDARTSPRCARHQPPQLHLRLPRLELRCRRQQHLHSRSAGLGSQADPGNDLPFASQGRDLGRVHLYQYGPGRGAAGRMDGLCRRGARSASSFRKMRYKWRQWAIYRLQLESRDRGVSRTLSRRCARTASCSHMAIITPIRDSSACIRFRASTCARPTSPPPRSGGTDARGQGRARSARVDLPADHARITRRSTSPPPPKRW